jgi:hypothetical protein
VDNDALICGIDYGKHIPESADGRRLPYLRQRFNTVAESLLAGDDSWNRVAIRYTA